LTGNRHLAEIKMPEKKFAVRVCDAVNLETLWRAEASNGQ